MSGTDTNSNDGLTDTNSQPQQQRESAIEKISRQVDSAGFKMITKEEYERLTHKDSWFSTWIKSPAFLTALFVALITYGWTLIDYGLSKYIKEKVQEVSNEQSQTTQQPTQNITKG